MKAIVIVDRNWGIGWQGRQPFTIPEDLAFFRRQTEGRVVVMGHRTLAALPGGRPLPGRKNIVLTRNPLAPLPEGCIGTDLAGLSGLLTGYAPDEVFVIGGGQVYALLLPYCSEALVTRVDVEAGADTWFPNLEEKIEWKITGKSEIKYFKNVSYQFLRYLQSAAARLA